MQWQLGCKELSVGFDHQEETVQVLDRITLSITRGEKVLILGPSGSGKSTLLSALSGIIPDHVEAEVEGEIYRQEACGVMFQDPDTQFCMLHVDEEIAFSLENRRVPRGEMDGIIRQVMQMVGLQLEPHTPIDTLSGGMKQRLALACLLALEPDVLFFDEPTAQLDPVSRRDVFRLLREVAGKTGQTMVFVEHVLDGCIEWMDRVILLDRHGQIIADGEPAHIVTHYRQQMEEAGIWLPRLFPYSWQEVVNDPSHPLADVLRRELGERMERDRQASLSSSAASSIHTLSANVSAANAAVIIQTDQLSIGYRKRPVMQQINLSLPAGEWIAITGQNGSGKSTFLKSLLRLEPLLSGRIMLQGKELRKWPDRDLYAQAGFVFQNPELQFVTDTVYDEIAFGGRQRGWPEELLREKTVQLLQEFGLEDYQDQHPFTLSLGQKRRLSVATMLLFDQELLLLDEPTFGQDARTAAELIRRLKQRQQQGTTIIMVTHDMDLVDEHADRLILFRQGEVAYDGTPYRLFTDQKLLQDSAIIAPLHYRLNHQREERGII
ncbi:ABC transporter ATP-binding protein [Paenibacillus wulumuqiensis]|uniref:ABC transporter ATP-binding protein n=1 Tax=Paenibacillus wulumuqiensis TaxID=1567107 RepID=UPI000619FA21|nr:ABC transporter ATP-binding protein [Paenibacillus wulumuqiensis]